MAAEQATVQQIAQLMNSGINVSIKSSDLLFLLLQHDNDVLKDWMDKGNALDTIFVPYSEGLEFYSRATQQGIALEKLNIREDTPLYRSYLKLTEMKMREAGISEEEIEKALSEQKFSCFEIRDVDKERAVELRNTIGRERNSSMILNPDQANAMFRDADINLFHDLNKTQAGILQREFAENGVYSVMTYDKDTQSYEIEVSSVDTVRPFPNVMSRVEVSVQDALIKMSLPEMVEKLQHNEIQQQLINKTIQDEIRELDNPLHEEMAIYDSFDPLNRIELKDGQAVLITNNEEKNRVFDLTNNDDIRELRREVDKFNAPDVAKLNIYDAVRREQKDNIEAFEQHGFLEEAEKIKSFMILEGVVNQAAEKIRKENLMQTNFHADKEYDGKIENVQKEIRIDNSDKITDIMLSCKVDPQEVKAGTDQKAFQEEYFKKVFENMNKNMEHMQITKDGTYKDIELQIKDDPKNLEKIINLKNPVYYDMEGRKVDTSDLEKFFPEQEEVSLGKGDFQIDNAQNLVDTFSQPENPAYQYDTPEQDVPEHDEDGFEFNGTEDYTGTFDPGEGGYHYDMPDEDEKDREDPDLDFEAEYDDTDFFGFEER